MLKCKIVSSCLQDKGVRIVNTVDNSFLAEVWQMLETIKAAVRWGDQR